MKRTILLIGGTGPMGQYCQEIMDDGNTEIIITSRGKHKSDRKSIRFIQGDAMDISFLKSVLSLKYYDAIVDFMLYSVSVFEERVDLLLQSTIQYVFLSSARIYAGQEYPLTEDSPRLLDYCGDSNYLQTHEYALEKARCEDILKNSGKNNYTIVRPYITYGVYRLQLGVLEKENCLYRALHGLFFVFLDVIASKKTTMTFGKDVATGITSLIGREETYGEAFHITYRNSYSWNDILSAYLRTLKKHGITPNVVILKKSLSLLYPSNKYQVIYCRYFNRYFDNNKIGQFMDLNQFTDTMDGLDACLEKFLRNSIFSKIDWIMEAFLDKATKEHTPLNEIDGFPAKIRYLVARYTRYYEIRLKMSTTR